MTGSIETLFIAAVTFVGAHFLLASQPVRAGVVQAIGERGFMIAYSAISGVLFVWRLLAYGDAPYVDVWYPAPWTRHVVFTIMPFSVLLVVLGYLTPNPTALGGERAFEAPDPAPGIFRITRHPVMWGIGLWALSHLAANGDQASIVLFAGLAILAFGGMVAVDAKRARKMGAKWGPLAMTTSILPFMAILEGRTRFDWAGIGWRRVGIALAGFLLLLLGHPYFAGVSLVH